MPTGFGIDVEKDGGALASEEGLPPADLEGAREARARGEKASGEGLLHQAWVDEGVHVLIRVGVHQAEDVLANELERAVVEESGGFLVGMVIFGNGREVGDVEAGDPAFRGGTEGAREDVAHVDAADHGAGSVWG
jgi:hypothetical protein